MLKTDESEMENGRCYETLENVFSPQPSEKSGPKIKGVWDSQGNKIYERKVSEQNSTFKIYIERMRNCQGDSRMLGKFNVYLHILERHTHTQKLFICWLTHNSGARTPTRSPTWVAETQLLSSHPLPALGGAWADAGSGVEYPGLKLPLPHGLWLYQLMA